MTLPVGTVEQILSAKDSQAVPFEVAEWECSILLRGLTRAEVLQLGEEGISESEAGILTVQWCIVEPVFSREDAEKLMQKSYGVMKPILHEIECLSGMRQRPEAKRDDSDTFPETA